MERPGAEEYQPPVTLLGFGWRLAAMLLISFLAYTAAEEHLEPQWRVVADLAVGAVGYVLVLFRRQRPLGVAVAISMLTIVSASETGPAVLAAVSLATRRRPPEIALLLVVMLTSVGLFYWVHPPDQEVVWWELAGYVVAWAVIQLAWGMFIGSRRELIWQLDTRNEQAETERDERAERAREQERARIAREMHDVLGHRITQISMHAGALAFRDDLTPTELRDGASRIQQNANAALTDLRGVLGVLRDASTGDIVEPPQPTYDELPRLVASAREAGMRVDFHDGVNGLVPPTTGRALFRILQEALTNAGKHAPGGMVSISVIGSPGAGIDLIVRNPLGYGGSGAKGSGMGLIGLAERAQLSGGRLDHRTEDGMFVLSGWIPWPSTTPTEKAASVEPDVENGETP